MALLYIEKIPAAIRTAFAAKVEAVAAYLEIQPDWLMQVMWSESKLKPTAANRQGKDKHLVAAGLLQFTTGSGIVKAGKVASIAAILKMTAVRQLDLVQWYFSSFRGRMKSYYDVYAITFFPALIGKPDDWVLQTSKLSAALIAKQNPVIAQGKSFITVADFKTYVYQIVPESLRERLFGAVATIIQKAEEEVVQIATDVTTDITNHSKESMGLGTAILIGFCVLGWFYIRKG